MAKTTPRARFESIAIGVYEALQVKPDLITTREKTDAIVNSKNFSTIVTSDGSNAKSKLIGRITVMKNALLKDD
jgi:hypothetical protein